MHPLEPFVKLTFDGRRFADHSIPVELLAEFAAFQQLIFKVARELFLKRFPDRKRLPNGFPEAAQLRLASTEENCFTGHLIRARPAVLPEPLDFTWFDRARDVSIAALGSVASGHTLPEDFPREALALLASLGKRLDDDESLTIRHGSAAGKIDLASRGRLAAMTKRPLERLETVEGEVEEVYDGTSKFVLRTLSGERVEVSFDLVDRDEVVLALQFRPIALVSVHGQMIAGTPKKMKPDELELIEHARSDDVLKAWNRLETFKNIEHGWLEGEGQAPSPKALSVARGVLARLMVGDVDLPRPRIYPTPEGDVQAEWVLGRWAADVTFKADDGLIEAAATHADTGAERFMTFTRTDVSPDDARSLSAWLEALVPEV